MYSRFELSKLQSSPPSTPTGSTMSLTSNSSSSESSQTQSIISDSMLQLPLPSDSTLASKRGSLDSGYASPKKKNNHLTEKQQQNNKKSSTAIKQG